MDMTVALELLAGFALTAAAVLGAVVRLATSTNRAARWFQQRLLGPVAADVEGLRQEVGLLARSLTEISILGQSLPDATRVDAAQRWLESGYDGLTAVRARAVIDSYRAELADSGKEQ